MTIASLDPKPIYRIDPHGQLRRWGVIHVTPPGVFVIHHDDGTVVSTEGLPWWLLDMRPQGFVGRSFAERHGAALGLSASINDWSDSEALRVLLHHGHDVSGNLLIGDQARDHLLSQSAPAPVSIADKGSVYADLAQKAMQGDLSGSFVAGEQPKFTAYAQTPAGPRHVLVKFSLTELNPGTKPVIERWQDLLLAEHHALETLRDTGHMAAASWVHDHHGQRFLEVERFDRDGRLCRLGLVSLAALEAEFVGNPRAPWPVLVEELARQKIVTQDSVFGTQTLFAFGQLIGNTDMHNGNLSFLTDGGMPYALAPAYDMLPMAFAPGANGSIRDDLDPARRHAAVSDQVWQQMQKLARHYFERLKTDERFSEGFGPCRAAMKRQSATADRIAHHKGRNPQERQK